MNDDGYTRITLRIPNDLHAKLTAEAARSSRSMNAEIIGRLRTGIRDEEDFEIHRARVAEFAEGVRDPPVREQGIIPMPLAHRLMTNMGLAHHAQDVIDTLKQKKGLSAVEVADLHRHEQLAKDLYDEMTAIAKELAASRGRRT